MSRFSRGIQEIYDGKVLAPILRAELNKPRFRKFSIVIERWSERPPDGWFHPSTHSNWEARQLLLYLTDPDKITVEEPTLEKIIAVNQGHFFHALAGRVLKQNGIMKELEIYHEDRKFNRRGHMDGRMEKEGWEFKTMNNDFLLKKVYCTDDLKQYKPGYFSQAQDYMDMHDLDHMRYLIMGMFHPYPMNEFVVDRDDLFIARQRRKYTEVLERYHEQEHELPERCCDPHSKIAKSCPLNAACPVGRVTLGLPAVRVS